MMIEIIILVVGGLFAAGVWFWYYASLGKRIYEEEKKAGRDLTFEINPFTGSIVDHSKDDKKQYS